MREDKIINKPLDIPFKEFMPGQIIQSVQFNDDMKDIEDKVNEIVDKHNLGVNKLHDHLEDLNNPHNVTPHQIGTYTNEEIDEFVDDIKNGNLFDKSISNRVLDDECVDTRVLQDGSVTVSKVDPELGSQLNLENNISITSRYTKEETDAIIQERVGDGTYSREEIDSKFEEYQAGTIVDGTISVDKLKYDVGTKLDISANPSIIDRYTKTEVNNLIQKNGLPKDWGGLGEVEEVIPITDYGYLPIADVMTADEFIAPLTPVLNIDVKENVDARGEYSSVGDRLNKNDEKQEELSSQLEQTMNNTNYVSVKSYGAIGDGVNDDTQAIQKCLNENNNVLFNDGVFNITSNLNIKSNQNILGLNGVLRSYTDNVIGLHGENVNNVTIDGLTFRCLEDGTGGLFNAIKIFNASNITLKNLDISTKQFGIFIHDIKNFTIENILFNQVRTTSFSNKDGVHINGNSHFGDIRNIKGTTDDDMIALNADEPFKNYGDISNITIDGVYSINKQSNGINNGTYQGIRFLSIVSKIYKINIKNCYIKADYYECFKITGYEENKGKYGEITIEDCHFYQELPHGLDVHTAFIDNCNIEKLTLRNITFEKPSTNGAFIRTTSSANINEFIIDNVKFKNTSETPFILIYLYGVIDKLTLRNINFRQSVNSALCVAREGTINTALFDGISINNCQNIFRSTTGSLVNDITFSNIKLNNGKNICEITNNSQIKKIFTSNIQCTDTTSCVVISTQQDNLRILQNNINGVVHTITKNTSNLGNVSVKGSTILFEPTVYNLGDEYCYVLDGVLTKKIYNGSYWVDVC